MIQTKDRPDSGTAAKQLRYRLRVPESGSHPFFRLRLLTLPAIWREEKSSILLACNLVLEIGRTIISDPR